MKKTMAIILALMVVLLGGYVFFESVNLNPLYFEGAFFWCFTITAFIVVGALLRLGDFTLNLRKIAEGDNVIHYEKKKKFPKWIIAVIAVPWVYLAVMVLIATPLLSWRAYRDQLGEVEVKKFSSEVQALDLDQIPIVDQALATKLADKKLGEKPALGSQVRLGTPTIQQVNGKLVWVVPLYHSGFFKWITNLSGSQGYVVVSATNVNDVEYVEDHRIKIQPGSYLLHDLKRHVRFGGGLFDGITDYSFEIDDEGTPYWVVTTYQNLRGFGLPEASGVLLVNAETGKIDRYSLQSLPSWVDRAQPEDFVINQIANKGEYVRGIFNFADKEKYKPSQGEIIVYNNGRCYLFTGLTSVGADDSAIGFMMVDMVTKKPLLYEMNGATENAAQKSAEGKVQNLQYRATFPLILNVDNEPSYFMALKDKEGLIKQYAYVSVTNYSVVGNGETIQAALQSYRQNLKNSGLAVDVPTNTMTAEGTVLRISQEFNGTETVYRIILSQERTKIFRASGSVSTELSLTQPGDAVSITYEDGDPADLAVLEFDNTAFTQK